MLAFHNNPKIKQKYLDRVNAHRLADEIIKGISWHDGKGSAVGCTIHSSNHKNYEIELGIPEWLAGVEETLFEGLPNELSKAWPLRFLSSIKPGVDLDKIKAPFLIFILEFTLDTFDHKKFPYVLESIQTVIRLYRQPTIHQKAALAALAAWAALAA